MNLAAEIASACAAVNHVGRALAAQMDDVRKKRIAETEERIRTGGFRQRGIWMRSETYRRNDVVKYDNTSWIAVEPSEGEKPRRGSKNWMIMAVGLSLGPSGQALYPEEVGYEILTEASPIVWNLVNKVATVTLTANRTITMSNGRAGGTYVLLVRQVAGGKQITWPSNVRFSTRMTPGLIAAANSVEQISFLYDGTVFYAFPVYPHST